MKTINLNKKNDDPKLWLIFLILLPWVINSIRQPTTDFGMFTDTTRDWVAGETQLYDEMHVYYNYLPWSVIVYLPFSLIPHPFGLLIFNTFTLGLLIWSTWSLVKPVRWWVLAISLTNLYTAMHLMLGQWDALILASLTLGWLGVQSKKPWLIGIALVGMTTKYTNIILPMLVLLYAIRKWSLKDLVRVAIFPIVILPLSFLIAGWDWPLRYMKLMSTTLAIYDHYEVITLFSSSSYQTSYWRYVPPLGSIFVIILVVLGSYFIFKLIRSRINLDSLLLAISMNLVITPYLAPQHIVYLAPVQAQLIKKNHILGFSLYVASIIDLFFMWLGIGIIIYPLMAFIIFMVYSYIELRNPILDN